MIDNNIYVDEDGLLVSGTENTQNTWMDVKIGNFAVTPRNGKAVEINSLWYNALKVLEKLSDKYGDMETKNYLTPEIVEIYLELQQVLCMSTENFTVVEEEYEGF